MATFITRRDGNHGVAHSLTITPRTSTSSIYFVALVIRVIIYLYNIMEF